MKTEMPCGHVVEPHPDCVDWCSECARLQALEDAPKFTIHGVLAGAYVGILGSTLTHASFDEGRTAVCGRVKPDALCDLEEPVLTCPRCIAKTSPKTASGKPRRPRASAATERMLRSELEASMREIGASAELVMALKQLSLASLGEFSMLVIDYGQAPSEEAREKTRLFVSLMVPDCPFHLLEQVSQFLEAFAKSCEEARVRR